MLDMKFIRDHTDLVKACLRNKGSDADLDELLALDERRRAIIGQGENLKRQRNEASQAISKLKRAGEVADAQIGAMRAVGDRIQELDRELTELEATIQRVLLETPNLHHPSCPLGVDEGDNQEVARWNVPRAFAFAQKPHWELGEQHGIIGFAEGVKISGSRFYTMRGLGARLERALIDFFLDLHIERHGYTEVLPPVLVRTECMVGTGQLPKFAEDAFHIPSDDLWLIPTAEVPVTNLHREEIIEPGRLPLKYVAYTPCFRREAGAAGKDTRGIIRVHQFNKVEMVLLVEPEGSYEVLEQLTRDACEALEALELPHRVVAICTGDLGFTRAKGYDVEVWMPAAERYVEISSCSNFDSFQARRANIRFRREPKAKPEFVHTLNGSGLAVGRTVAAILENCQNEDGSITLPTALRPYMRGVETIGSNQPELP